MTSGKLAAAASATVTVERAIPFAGVNTASRVTVSYPFTFVVLNPVMKLISKSTTTGKGITTMSSIATMRNES